MLPSNSPEYHVHSHPSAVEHWRHLLEIVALVVAAAWGVYVFVYQEDIKPALEQPNVDFTVNVEHTALGNGMELIAVTPSWKNRASERVQVDGFLMNVSGLSYSAHNIGPWRFEPVSAGSSTRVYSRGVNGVSTPVYAAFIAYRPLGGALYGLADPGDTKVIPLTFVVPEGRFNAMRFAEAWCIRRADDHRSFSFQPVRRADGTFDLSSLLGDERRRDVGVSCHLDVHGIERGI